MITLKTLDICYEILSELDVPDSLVYLRTGNCDIDGISHYQNVVSGYKHELKILINQIDEQSRIDFINRIIQSERTLRNSITPRYRFEDRWIILKNALLLDGYIINRSGIQEQDIIISEVIKSEDLLYSLISETELNDSEEIIRLLRNSKENFVAASPDYNACLINVRTPLETLVKAIANRVNEDKEDHKLLTHWGHSLAYLRSIDIITSKDEALFASTYSLLSELHRPIYFSDKEMTRYARSLGLSAIWYISNIYKNYLSGNTN